jgi:hypothetical protein
MPTNYGKEIAKEIIASAIADAIFGSTWVQGVNKRELKVLDNASSANTEAGKAAILTGTGLLQNNMLSSGLTGVSTALTFANSGQILRFDGIGLTPGAVTYTLPTPTADKIGNTFRFMGFSTGQNVILKTASTAVFLKGSLLNLKSDAGLAAQSAIPATNAAAGVVAAQVAAIFTPLLVLNGTTHTTLTLTAGNTLDLTFIAVSAVEYLITGWTAGGTAAAVS